MEKNQRLLFRSIEKPTHCPLLSFSFLPPRRTPATRARPKGGCERAGCIAGTERGKDVGPGGRRGAPRGSGSRRSPRSPHPPQQLLRGACMGLVVAVLPGPLARLGRASILRDHVVLGVVRRDFYTLPFHRCVTPLPLRLMLLLFPNAYDTLFELRRSHRLKWARRGCLIFYGSRYEIHDPFLSLYSH